MQDNQHIKDRATLVQKHLRDDGLTVKRHTALSLVAKLDGYRSYTAAVKGKQHGAGPGRKVEAAPRTYRQGYPHAEVVSDYVQACGRHCPACGSKKVSDGHNSNAGPLHWEFLVQCDDCRHEWWAQYTLTARDGYGLDTATAAKALAAEICPHCGAGTEDAYGGLVVGARTYQVMSCPSCRTTWMDLYDLTDLARTENVGLMVLENGEQQDLTDAQEVVLLAADVIYDNGDGCYHLTDGKSWSDLESFVATMPEKLQSASTVTRPVPHAA